MADTKISNLTNYTPPLDADVLPVVDTANTTTKKVTWANIKATLKTYFDTLYPSGSGTSTGTNTGNETTTTIGSLINGATDKTTPVNADYLGLMDSAASNILKKLSWANVKATLKTYFDTLYAAVGAYAPGGTDVATTDGGTGLSTIGSANQVLGVNNAANALEYKTITAGTGIDITHAANSITIAGKSPALIVASYFEATGRFGNTVVGTGSQTFGGEGLSMTTGATATSSNDTTFGWIGSNSINAVFSVKGRVTAAPTTGSSIWCVGQVTVAGAGITYTREHYGFKITYSGSVATLSATNANGTTETATDITSGITVTDTQRYVAVNTLSTNVKYYVGATLKATHTTNLPVGASENNMDFAISNNATATTFTMLLYGFNFQERDLLL